MILRILNKDVPLRNLFFVVGEGITIGLIGGVIGLLLSYPIVEKGMGVVLEEQFGVLA